MDEIRQFDALARWSGPAAEKGVPRFAGLSEHYAGELGPDFRNRADFTQNYWRGVRSAASFVLSSTGIGSISTARRTNWRSFSSKR